MTGKAIGQAAAARVPAEEASQETVALEGRTEEEVEAAEAAAVRAAKRSRLAVCGLGGCTKPPYHAGLCDVSELGERRERPRRGRPQ